jgi:endonuclease/exonuclease/phosphatase family metal-dependent hydrolase
MNRIAICIFPAMVFFLTSCSKVVNYAQDEGPVYFSSGTKQPPRHGDTLTVVTYNVELSTRIDAAIADISSSDELRRADLIMLQEMDYPGVARIARELGYNFVYYPAVWRPDTDRDFGNAVLSKWPLKEPQKVILPNLKAVRNMQRIATFTTVTIGEKELVCSSAHIEMFTMSRERRVEQVDSLSRAIPRDIPNIIVAGDFNSFRGSTLQSFDSLMTSAGLYRATEEVGWTAAFGLMGIFRFRLDHIYLKGFRVVDHGVVYGTEGSDHRPVWATIVWEES